MIVVLENSRNKDNILIWADSNSRPVEYESTLQITVLSKSVSTVRRRTCNSITLSCWIVSVLLTNTFRRLVYHVHWLYTFLIFTQQSGQFNWRIQTLVTFPLCNVYLSPPLRTLFVFGILYSKTNIKTDYCLILWLSRTGSNSAFNNTPIIVLTFNSQPFGI